MEKNKTQQPVDSKDHTGKNEKENVKNPFKDPSEKQNSEEAPDDAELEQQRKDAQRERD